MLLFSLGRHDESLVDLDKAIDKSEDNIPKHFYVRGLLQACSKNLKAALNDLSISINLDEKLAEGYFNRAKIF
jgi:tetratricopeptide (TPR) repeat protein